ncbi:MAG TPA: hypothetical protein VJQ56_12135, partial [Blastocatellia bacterium]|nr:hypothetical protein [Blastocatellia bacterium]
MQQGMYLKRVEPQELRNQERVVPRTTVYPTYHGHDEIVETEAGSGSSLEQYKRAVLRRKGMIVAVVVLVTASVAAWV